MKREDAWNLLCEWTQNEALRRHMLGVEAAMSWYARKHGEDEETWAVVGLLHDFDYERYPNLPDHPVKGSEVLRQKGLPEDMVRAILAHAPSTGVPRDTLMAKVLFAVDELVGFLFACAYVQPSRSIRDVKVSSVKKKLKDKGFARAVNREEIRQGVEEFGLELDVHIANVTEALIAVAPALGLDGAEKTHGSGGSSHEE
jgi:putative nucleotidyltransferase with HDIG domain